MIYLHIYYHGFSNFTDFLIWFLLENIGSNHDNISADIASYFFKVLQELIILNEVNYQFIYLLQG